MRKSDLSFAGKVCVVTGATRGIGQAIADLLAVLGAKVIVTGTSVQVPPLKPGQDYVPLDLADGPSREAFCRRMHDLDSVDVLVNNAGINYIESVEDILLDRWEQVLQVNLTGAMLLTREAARIMKAGGCRGRILNISSIFGVVSRAKRNAYSAAKAGLIGFTRSSALDLAPDGILVNALCPGFTLTDLTARSLSAEEKRTLEGEVPLGRFAGVEEMARAAVFLCSEANSFMTGQALVVDGGYCTP